MPTKKQKLIAMSAPVAITAAEAAEGEQQGPPKFDVTAYTGDAMWLNGWDQPVVIELSGMGFSNTLVANLDHESSKRVGHVTAKDKSDGKLQLSGIASAATAYRDEVVNSAAGGFNWQASIEAYPEKVVEVAAGKTVQANGREFTGPLYLVKKSKLTGFAFVSHGADDNTSVAIAARAAFSKEQKMKPELKKWIEAMGFDVDELSAEQVAGLEANFNGQQKKETPKIDANLSDPLEAQKLEAARVESIKEHAVAACAGRTSDEIGTIQQLVAAAIENKQSVKDFQFALLANSLPAGYAPRNTSRRNNGITTKVIEAAVCRAGRLGGEWEKKFDEQTLEAADKHFKSGIGLKQLILLAAESRGYRPSSYAADVTPEVMRAAFGIGGYGEGAQLRAGIGYSYVDISTILSNTANKFLKDGWNAVDQTPLRIAPVRSVRDFKEITTVSLIGDLTFEKVGPAGELKHGSLGEYTVGNKADTYARMLAITRQDIINDDLGALTVVPRKLGRGANLKLNDIFWTEFLNPSIANFFHSDNANVSTADGTLGLTGLSQAEAIFMKQTDPDGNPLLSQPAILLVPTELKATAWTLMNSEKVKGDTDEPDANPWRARFRVESSPYMSNSNYSGQSNVAWYLLADPMDLPVIEIVALNGNVEPNVETVQASPDTLGINMLGYSDIGVRMQYPQGGVRADGSGA